MTKDLYVIEFFYMSLALSNAQEDQKKFGFLLSIRWAIFFFALFFTAIKTFTNPFSSYYYDWLFGIFLVLNLTYSFLYIKKLTCLHFLPLR